MTAEHPKKFGIKRGSTGVPYGLVVGLIAVVALAATQTIGTSVVSLFDETGSTLGDVVDSTSPPAGPTPEAAPSSFDFSDATNADTATQTESTIEQISVSGPVTVSISGDGSPEFRICADSGCSSEVHSWGSASQSLADGQYLQLRLTSSSSHDTDQTATVSVGTGSDDWAVTTGSAPVEIVFQSSYNAARVHGYEYTGPSQTLTWDVHRDTCVANDAIVPGSTTSHTNKYCSYSPTERHVVTTNCNWSSQSFSNVRGSVPSGATGYMCAHLNCNHQIQISGSSASGHSSGTVTIDPGDYVFCSAPVESDDIVWQTTHSTYHTRVKAYEYTGPNTTLTWQVQHDTCQSYGKVTPGSTSHQSQYCAYASNQFYVVTQTCNWNSQGFNRLSGTVPSGHTAYMCSHLNCDHQQRVSGTTRSTHSGSTVTINTGDYVFCSP